MGLYICVFDGDEEIDGVEVGPYEEFNNLRSYVARELEGGMAGSKFPEFMLHSDPDGEWGANVCEELKAELKEIIAAMKSRPPIPYSSKWQSDVARKVGISPKSALESFIDVDGEVVLERIYNLVVIALERRLPVLFQ